MLWRHAMDSRDMYLKKWVTLYHPKEWERALSMCVTCKPAIQALHAKIFGEGPKEYLGHRLSAEDFVKALETI